MPLLAPITPPKTRTSRHAARLPVSGVAVFPHAHHPTEQPSSSSGAIAKNRPGAAAFIDLRGWVKVPTIHGMSTVLEIEQAVEHLPEADFQTFAHWFDETRAQRVDAAFEKAILAGQFDAMAAQALRDMDAGRTTPLDEFLRRA